MPVRDVIRVFIHTRLCSLNKNNNNNRTIALC